MEELEKIQTDAIIEASKFDKDDWFYLSKNYFWCGKQDNQKYNFPYAMVIEIVGKIFGDKKCKNSDYHKGVAYLANELKISKGQIKTLRRNFKRKKDYYYKIPYSVVSIMLILIGMLESHQYELLEKFCMIQKTTIYRDMLLGEIYVAMRNAANISKDEEILEIVGKLYELIQGMENEK